jgi:3-hydroxy-9,10-secoandrosta-1,3,5(10)-triene-9,17-dione monooxygenase
MLVCRMSLSSSPADLLERARALGELAAAHRDQAERDRRLADPVVEAMVSSGLFRLLRSQRLGGLEVEPKLYLEVVREIARHEVSAGWIFGVVSIHEWFMSYTTPQLQSDVWGSDPDALVVDSIAPVGRAEKADDGFVVNGTWRFVSGVEWCSWVAVNAITQMPDGEGPEPVLYFIPRQDLRVADEWHVVGLRGTASNTVTVENVFVPEHRILPVMRVSASGRAMGPMLDEGPLYRMPFLPMLALGIFPASLGGAQQALDSFQKWTAGRIRPFQRGAAARQMPGPQLALAEASTSWDAAHALAIRYAEELYALGQADQPTLDLDTDARLFAWRSWIARTSAQVSDRLFLESGGNAIFESHEMQRAWRDTHAAAQHVSVGFSEAMTSRGSTLFDLPSESLI